MFIVFFFSSRRRHTRWNCDWSSDVCSSDLAHLADHAAGRMLHFFYVGFDDDRSRRDQCPRDLGRRRPATKPAGKNDDHRQTDDQMQPYRLPRSALFAAAHDLATPPSDTILMGVGGATRCSTCPRTVSLGPNACMRPSFNTSS